jgi:hypothetical protein
MGARQRLADKDELEALKSSFCLISRALAVSHIPRINARDACAHDIPDIL